MGVLVPGARRGGGEDSGAGPFHDERGETGRRPDRPAVGHGDGLADAVAPANSATVYRGPRAPGAARGGGVGGGAGKRKPPEGRPRRSVLDSAPPTRVARTRAVQLFLRCYTCASVCCILII